MNDKLCRIENDTLVTLWNCGFFSCMSQRLHCIITYSHIKKAYPVKIDSSAQFEVAKPVAQDLTTDVTHRFIKTKIENVPEYISGTVFTDQFTDYKKLDYANLNSIIKTYFEPSEEVYDKIKKYKESLAIDYDNTCGVFYRGNDKWKECKIASHEEFIYKALELKEQNPNIKFFVQTDEEAFLQKFIEKFPNSVYIDELERMNNKESIVGFQLERGTDTRINHSIKLVAAVNILAKCKILITHTGNCGFWSALYRGHANNLIQYYSDSSNKNVGKWI